jgi:hypothetical protein
MGLFVVGRLAHMHGMAVRLRNAVEGEPSSGTTAELYIPPKLLEHGEPIGADARRYDAPVEALGEDDVYAEEFPAVAEPESVDPSGLPRRSPGSSGITSAPPQPEPEPQPSQWFAQADEPAPVREHPTDTAPFFSSRARAEQAREENIDISDMDVVAAELAAPEPEDTDTDFIYQKMLNEIMVDPHTLVVPQDWKSVWDNGWETASEVENIPVQEHTEHGLPVRDPGARLVPGAADQAPAPDLAKRDPDAVRASFSSHFGGVRAARSDIQTGSVENGRDHQ